MKLQITVDGKTYEVEVEISEEDEGALEQRAALASPPPPPPPPTAYAQNYPVPVAADPKTLRSPVMGLAIKVDVEPGQIVEAGQQMLVLEAMKMETNVTAPTAGTVKTVHVKQGEPVKLNQPLVEFE